MPAKTIIDDPVGVGVAYPFRFADGSLALTATKRVLVPSEDGIGDGQRQKVSVLVASDSERIATVRQAIRRVIEVRQGSQFMEGEAGSLADLVTFETNDEPGQNLASYYAASAVSAQVDRVEVVDVDFVQVEDSSIMDCILAFRIRRLGTSGNVRISNEGAL